MIEKGEFLNELDCIERRMKFASSRLKMLRLAYEGKNEVLYSETLRFQTTMERTALLARNLPYFVWRKQARIDVIKNVLECVPHEIGFTKEGWFSLRLPMLLPKKNSGSVDYIREVTYPIMYNFFKDKDRVRFKDCVIIYRHVYGKEYPSMRMRDHDNIEVNQVTDIIALYLMPDDNPNVCNHYYMSARGSENRTEIYVVPKTDFVLWLNEEKNMEDKGVKLFETQQ